MKTNTYGPKMFKKFSIFHRPPFGFFWIFDPIPASVLIWWRYYPSFFHFQKIKQASVVNRAKYYIHCKKVRINEKFMVLHFLIIMHFSFSCKFSYFSLPWITLESVYLAIKCSISIILNLCPWTKIRNSEQEPNFQHYRPVYQPPIRNVRFVTITDIRNRLKLFDQ